MVGSGGPLGAGSVGLGLKLAGAIGATLTILTVSVVLLIAVALGADASSDADQAATEASCSIDPATANAPPPDLMPIYEEAAARYDLGPDGWAVLAAINRIETAFGAILAISTAGAMGWMQFMPATWAAYKVDANGGGANPNDPEDAIYSAANYLKALLENARTRRIGRRAPSPEHTASDWRQAVWGYNHADWYVDDVLSHADSYIGACTFAANGVVLGDVVKVPASSPWLATVPGTSVQCDRRIVENVRYLIERFKLRLGSCYAPTGHSRSGEHPLGLAIDVTPADGDWRNTMNAARSVGWDESCATRGCPSSQARWIGYNGVRDHGDPQHCTGGCPPHLHISWNHSPATYNTQAGSVDVWNLRADPRR